VRHRRDVRRLGRPTDQRLALIRNLVCSIFEESSEGKLTTTEARAKAARQLVDRMITLARDDTVHARRMARRVLGDQHMVKRLFDEIGPQFKDRPGGYTRMVRLGARRGDAAELVRLELVGYTP
jgi:large subunit ribosomal protein L17